MALLQNFNISTERLPLPSSHIHFISEDMGPRCDRVPDLPFEERCEYVQTNEKCSDDVRMINYLHFMYCTLEPETPFGIMIGCMLLIFCMIVLFMVMGLAADEFFVPALAILSERMGLSETVSGVTLLAFGNGSPDIITTLTVIQTPQSAIMYSELLGAAMFITTFIAGTIIIVSPFSIYPPHFVRDVLFFIAAVEFVDWSAATTKSNVSLWESIMVLLIYIFYLIVVVTDQIMSNRALRDSSVAGFEVHRDATTLNLVPRLSAVSVGGVFIGVGPNDKIFKQFLESINPIDLDAWRSSTILSKIFMVLKAPILFGLRLFIPLFDVDAENEGWSKLLNCSQLATLSLLITFGVEAAHILVFGIPLYLIVAPVGLTLGIIVFFTSRTDRAPKYHLAFLFWNLVGSMFIIWIFADEIVNLLQTFGMVLDLSMSFLGGTTLAWGNSIGDLFSNLSLARQGYVKMGFAGCYGGPMFNVLVGISITMIYKCATRRDLAFVMSKGYLGDNCSLFLQIALYSTVIALAFTNFAARRSIGIFLIILYGIFLINCLLSEMSAIHAIGTNHLD